MTLKQETGLRNQKEGRRFEMKVWNQVNHSNCLARAISSGSKGLFDVWSLEGNKIRLISCKKSGYLTPRERKELAEFMETKPAFAQVEVHYYISPKKVKKTIIKSANQILNWME